MVFLAPILVLLGALISRWVKVIVLVPATVIVWIAAAQFAKIDALGAWQTLVAVFLCGACLQLGYLAGAVLLAQRQAALRKRAVVTIRRSH
jgi:hypothetical protein